MSRTKKTNHPTTDGGIKLKVDGIPEDLKSLDQWVTWRSEERKGKPGKIPYCATSGERADATDPKTWCCLDDAMAAYSSSGDRYDGIGIVFSKDDEFTGIDLDDCLDEEGKPYPGALKIIDSFATYTEVSPSGRGVKMWLRGEKPTDRCRGKTSWGDGRDGEIEVYDKGRYFTVTGLCLTDTPSDIRPAQEALDELCREFLDPPKKSQNSRNGGANPPLDDEELMRLARNAKNGDKFEALYEDGDLSGHGDDHSRADAALVTMLIYWCGPDANRIDRLFRQSALMRSKWDEGRGESTYGERTIRAALDSFSGSFYRPGHGPGAYVVESADPLPLADHYLNTHHRTEQGRPTLLRHRGEFLKFTGSCYATMSDETLTADIYRHLEKLSIAKPGGKDKEAQRPRVKPKSSLVREVRLALPSRDGVLVPDDVEPPCWLDAKEATDTSHIVACRNGLLDLKTGDLQAHSPEFFNRNVLAIDYDPKAPKPTTWFAFLKDIFGDDTESRNALQEFIGYLLTPDTRQQKILLIVGPKRSGKGTIGRTITRLLGHENVCGPTLNSLMDRFGLEPLVNKRVAIVSDARLSGRTDKSIITERLLSISGEDVLSVPRKHRLDWTGHLTARFILMSNELPKLEDSSGALAFRFIVLMLTKSFYGREDTTLSDRIAGELPGILNWAVGGWKRLDERGHFAQPKSSIGAVQELEDLGSPMAAFVRDRCVVGSDQSVLVHDLFVAWRTWCDEHGDKPGSEQTMGRDLRAVVSTLRTRRPRGETAERKRVYDGIGLMNR